MKSLKPDEEFTRQVHRALHHLYEPADLHLSPLATILHVQTKADVPTELRKILLEGIDALKPDPKVPPDSNAWRVYQVLTYRFVELFSQEEVAAQMAISPRQVRRLEHTAIQALADHLTARFPSSQSGPGDSSAAISSAGTTSSSPVQGDQQEFDWLRKSYQKDTTDVYRLVESVIKTSESLLLKSAVEIHTEIASELPLIAGQMTTLRQVLLNLLLAAVRSCPGGSISLKVSGREEKVQILMEARLEGQAVCPPDEISDYLDLARRLVELSEGELEILAVNPDRTFGARISFPPVEQINVLVVDDNEDSLRLVERYLTGTTFLFNGTSDPQKTLSLAEEIGPGIILLDIMLPEVDGYELLGRIRAHPTLGDVPVVIATILPHEQLAGSLGADGFLRKPFSREMLLEMLGQLLSRPVPGLH